MVHKKTLKNRRRIFLLRYVYFIQPASGFRAHMLIFYTNSEQ